MTQDLSIAVSTAPSSGEIHELREQLLAYNTSRVGEPQYTPLLLTIRDSAGKLEGGLSGSIYYNWLFIDLFWVAEHLRGQGRGRALLAQAEEEARRRECTHVWLDTFSFQSREFYEQNGYVVFGELPEYPKGHKRWFLRKPLDPAAETSFTPSALDDYYYGLLTGGSRYFLLMSALDLNLPVLLKDGPMTADAIIARLHVDPHRGKKWLHAMHLAGLLDSVPEGYKNSTGIDAIFARTEGTWFYREFLRYWRVSNNHNLLDALRGAPIRQTVRYPPQDPGDVALLHLWMHNTAITTLETIETHVDFRPVHKLLDVAGGDGTMATILAQKYPNLDITIFNVPAAAALAQTRAENSGVADRVKTIAGDFRHHPFPGGNDMVMFSRVMADWSPDVCRMLMIKSRGALAPGGKLVICEPLQDQNENLAVAWEHSYLPYDDFGLAVYKPLAVYERLLKETGFRIIKVAPRDDKTIHCVIISEAAD